MRNGRIIALAIASTSLAACANMPQLPQLPSPNSLLQPSATSLPGYSPAEGAASAQIGLAVKGFHKLSPVLASTISSAEPFIQKVVATVACLQPKVEMGYETDMNPLLPYIAANSNGAGTAWDFYHGPYSQIQGFHGGCLQVKKLFGWRTNKQGNALNFVGVFYYQSTGEYARQVFYLTKGQNGSWYINGLS